MDRRVVVALDGATNASTAALLAAARGQDVTVQVGGCDARWRVLARRMDLDGRGQARVLLRLVDEMLGETGRGPEDIAAIIAGVGPGTFTGVRIAVATARALALALDIPILGVSTLSAMAAGAVGMEAFPEGGVPDAIVPVVDARRGQLFYGVYRRAGSMAGDGVESLGTGQSPLFVRTEPFAVCDRDSLLPNAAPKEGRTLIVGDLDGLGTPSRSGGPRLLPLNVGAEHLLIGQDKLEEPGVGVEGSRLDGWLEQALSGRAGGGRTSGWECGEPGSPEAVKPIYVRSPDADIHITKMRDPWAAPSAER